MEIAAIADAGSGYDAGMPSDLATRYRAVRARTAALAGLLSPEDAQVQSMPEASPAKWHLAHTTWFFWCFVLGGPRRVLPEGWDTLFNSYYVGVGAFHERAQRGLLSRPTLVEVLAWREAIDARILESLATDGLTGGQRDTLLLGLHHEQQHQELLLTDIKHAFWCNPLGPAYDVDDPVDAGVFAAGDASGREARPGVASAPVHPVEADADWLEHGETIAWIGAPRWPAEGAGFAFDNESPRHRVLLAAHAIARHPVSNAGYAEFVADGGYDTPSLWLSDGWDRVRREGWRRPLYWHEDGVREFTLAGWRERDPRTAVRHLSHYEADAYARWAGARLPTEPEWEHAAAALEGRGQVWEWTSSAYGPYPGFRPMPGALGEYNGKFMSGQLVLRGGSCATPAGETRNTCRNFFWPHARWQFSGLRLAKDLAT